MSLIKPWWKCLPESSPHSSVGIRRQKYAGTAMRVISHDVWAYYIGCLSQLEPSAANHRPFSEVIGLDCLIHPHPRLGLRNTEEETPNGTTLTLDYSGESIKQKPHTFLLWVVSFAGFFFPPTGRVFQKVPNYSLCIFLFFSSWFSLQCSGLAFFFHPASLLFVTDSLVRTNFGPSWSSHPSFQHCSPIQKHPVDLASPPPLVSQFHSYLSKLGTPVSLSGHPRIIKIWSRCSYVCDSTLSGHCSFFLLIIWYRCSLSAGENWQFCRQSVLHRPLLRWFAQSPMVLYVCQ